MTDVLTYEVPWPTRLRTLGLGIHWLQLEVTDGHGVLRWRGRRRSGETDVADRGLSRRSPEDSAAEED
jgi:hypothetical protein